MTNCGEISQIQELDMIKMMDYRDKFKDGVCDSSATGADGKQQGDVESACGDLSQGRVSYCHWENLDSDVTCSLCSDDSNSAWQEHESRHVFTENGQGYHAQDNYPEPLSKDTDGEFSIGIRDTEYCIWNSFVAAETANRHCETIKVASHKSKCRRSRIQAVVIVAAFVLSSIVLLCVLILALV